MPSTYVRDNKDFRKRMGALADKRDAHYIGHLGKQDSAFDNTLAENAEAVYVPRPSIVRAVFCALLNWARDMWRRDDGL